MITQKTNVFTGRSPSATISQPHRYGSKKLSNQAIELGSERTCNHRAFYNTLRCRLVPLGIAYTIVFDKYDDSALCLEQSAEASICDRVV